MDMTPMLDVLFMLIIFFVLTTSFARLETQRVDLPKGRGERTEVKAAVITITSNGEILLDGKPSSLGELKTRLRGHPRVLLGAHRGVPYGRVAELLSALRSAGVESAGLLLEGSSN